MNKKIFLFLLISILFFNYSFVFAYPAYTQNSTLSIVGPYDTAVSGGGNWSVQPPYREFITIGQKYRIRQSGTISRIRIYAASINSLTGFYLKIWRKTGANSYDLVGTSNNLISNLVSGDYANIDLTSPITGVREGDYYSYRGEGAGVFYARSGITGVTSYYVTGATPSATGYGWESQTAAAGYALPIEIYMYAPQVAFIGDSIIAGHPGHYSFLETTATTNATSTIEFQLGNITGYTYQNMGIGSQTTTSISARFTSDIINLKPRAVIIEGGVNDIAGSVSKATFLANWTSMLNAAQAEPAIKNVIVLKILPWTNGTNTQMQTRDDWNASLTTLAASYSKAVVVDASSYVGQNRVSGDAGNLWDIQTAYNADGVHYNQTGHTQIAQAIAATLNTITDDLTPPTITGITSTNNSGSYRAGQAINLTVNFSENVNTSGNVILTLNTIPARTCAFSTSHSMSGSCVYVVQQGDSVSPLEVSNISGTIVDESDNQLTNYTPASNLSSSKNINVTGVLVNYPPYSSNSSLSLIGPYDVVTSGAANWGCGITSLCSSGYTRDFITIGQKYRVRQTGTISRIKIYTVSTANLTGFYLKIWRKTGTNSYNLIGTSNNLVGSLANSSFSTIDLTTPITGVQEGDYYGYSVAATVVANPFSAKTGISNVTSYFVTNSSPSSTGYAWESQQNIAGAVLPIELYAQSPQFVFIGDEIFAGHPANYSFLETTSTVNIASTIENQFNGLTSYSYQNMGVGGQATAQIASRFTSDVVNLKPRAVVIEGGVNDIIGGVSKSTFLTNWTAMLNAAQSSADITSIFVLKILPWTNGTNTQMQTRDDWNASLTTLAASYSKAVVVDASSYVGQNRAGGDSGNLWDIKAAYNSDGINYNATGLGQIALASADSLDSIAPTIASVTSSNNSGTYKAGQTIQLNINFSEVVNATSSASLVLNTTPARGCSFNVSNSATSTCDYVVQDGDNAAILNVAIISGTIKDLVDNPMTNFALAANLSASKTIVIDTVAPVVSISSFPIVNAANQNAVTISGVCSENGLPVSLTIGSATAVPTCSSGAWSTVVDLHTLTDGTLTANISQTDAAGNTGSNSLTSTKDTDGPAVTGLSNDATPAKSKTWTWSYGEESATFRYAIDQILTWTADGDFASTTTAIQSNGSGTYYLHVQAQDGAGNASEVATVFAILDNTPPVITVSGDNPVTIAQGSTYADSGATASDNIDSGVTVITSGSVDTAALGDYIITYNAADVASNAAAAVTRSVHVTDQEAPTISELSDDSTPRKTKTWAWSGEEGDTFRFAVDRNATTTLEGEYGDVASAAQASGNGTYYLHVQSKDAAGNESEVTTVFALLDNTAPTISETAVTVSRAASIISWNTNEAASSKVEFGLTNSYGEITAETDNPLGVSGHSVNLSGLDACSTYHYRAISKDGAGNEAIGEDETFKTECGSSQKPSFNYQSQVSGQIQNIQQEIARLQGLLGMMNAANTGNALGNKYSCAAITKNLYYGMANDPQVYCLQEFLAGQGAVIYPEARITGNFYQMTKAAVIRFQEKYQSDILTPFGLIHGNGFVGLKTRQKINQLIGG